MTTQYTPILKLALPVTGELSGTWGTVVNDNITSMVEQAVAGLATISTWTPSPGNAHTLTTADGTSSESRCAMLVLATGSGGSALTGAGEVICPAASKLYVVKNGSAYAVTVKTSAGTGVAIPAGDTAFVFCDGTNVNACVTTIVNGHISGNLTVDGNTTLGDATSDTITATARFNTDLLPSTDNARDLGSTANSWRTLYCETSVIAANITISGNTISSTDTNGNITLAPNGTGDVQLDADTIRVGDSGANVTITSNGAGDLILNTNSGTNSGSITIEDGANGNIALAPNGTGQVTISTALDLTTLEVTNIKAKDGTAAITLADSTGVATFSANPIINAGTANGVPYLNGSKVLTTGSALTFDGTTLNLLGSANDIRSTATGGASFTKLTTDGIYASGTDLYLLAPSGKFISFYADNAEKMRLSGATGSVGALGIGYTSLTSVGDSGLAVLGNVGIGTNAPSRFVDIEKNQNASTILRVGNTTSGTAAYSALQLASSTNTYLYNFSNGYTTSGKFEAGVTLLDANGSAGITLCATASAPIRFFTNDAERARITNGGFFKASPDATYIGSTSPYHEFLSDDNNANYVLQVRAKAATASNAFGIRISYATTPNSTGAAFWACDDSTANRATLRSNGGLANYQSNNVDLSDARTKTDINPLGSYWNKIAGLEIVTYKYKDQTHDDLNIGVIAQQVEQVAPEFVDPDGFGETPEDGVPLKTIYNKDLTFAAIKALQEAMARIEQLEAKVAALEAN